MAGRPPLHSAAELDARVRRAASEVFAAKGYEAATLDEIAQLAGVRKPALYRLHPSKSALFCDLLTNTARQAAMQAMSATEAHEGDDHRDRLLRTIDGWFAALEQNKVGWQVLHNAADHDADIAAVRARIRSMQIANDVTLIRAFLGGIDEREVVPLAEVLHGALISLGRWWLLHPDEPRSAPVAVMVRVCTGLLLTNEPRRSGATSTSTSATRPRKPRSPRLATDRRSSADSP